MKLKLVNFFIFFLFINISFAQGKEKKYIPSDKLYLEKLEQSFKGDFNNRIKIALEIVQKNPEVAINKIYEILILYRNQLKDNLYFEEILNNLSLLLRNQNNLDLFEKILEFLEKEKIITVEDKNSWINKLL